MEQEIITDLTGRLLRQGYDWDSELYRDLLEAIVFYNLENSFKTADEDTCRTIVARVYNNSKGADQLKYWDRLRKFLVDNASTIEADLRVFVSNPNHDILAPSILAEINSIVEITRCAMNEASIRDAVEIFARGESTEQYGLPLIARQNISKKLGWKLEKLNNVCRRRKDLLAYLLKKDLLGERDAGDGKLELRKSARIRSMAEPVDENAAILRLVEADPPDFEVREFPVKGKGIVAKKNFQRKELLLHYSGHVLTGKQAEQKEATYYQMPEIGSYMYWFKFLGQNYCIDATEDDHRYSRLINHSRKHPNCKTILKMINELPVVVFIASRDIKEGEELLYDYGERRKEICEMFPWLNE